MGQHCYLVSRPINGNKPSETLEWEAIGNGKAVPSLLDRKPFLEHWALCVMPTEDFDLSTPAARVAFLNGSYYDLEVGSSGQGWFKISSNSESYPLRDTLTWTAASVRKITCIEKLGSTAATEHRIRCYKKRLLRMWGKYRPLVWNCQHFAMFLAQIVVRSSDCASKIRHLLSMRSDWLSSVRSEWHEALAVASSVVGYYAAIVGLTMVPQLATDGVKDGKIWVTWGGWPFLFLGLTW
ncbi:hypothetical protein F4801DRAFT_558132 [Xylaria longipes]|nr:hypothetical protein F4801DRAFT_558132 [Xylaria longipes]